MKKTLLATAAVALVLALPVAGNALTLSVSGNLNASGNAGVGNGGATANGSASTTASIATAGGVSNDNGAAGNGSAGVAGNGSATAVANIDENSVISAFSADQATLDAIANLGATSKVEVVRIAPMVSANADAFNSAMSANSSATAKLQAAVAANADLNAQLGQNSIDVSTIVAANVAADGTLLLYSNS